MVVPCGTVTTTQQLARNYEFCLTGDGIEELRRISSSCSSSCGSLLNCVLPKTKVLSRVAPSQKEFVLASLRELGYTTLMCGDGTNDVGALKQAHVGEPSYCLIFCSYQLLAMPTCPIVAVYSYDVLIQRILRSFTKECYLRDIKSI